jgi:hypothetical protein
VRQDEAVDSASPYYVSDEAVGSLGEFFERIEKQRGPSLTEADHRLIVETIRMDRDRDD